MTSRKKENALGRGLDALIRPDFTNDENNNDKETKINS